MPRKRRSRRLHRVMEAIIQSNASWDRGVLEAHWMHNVPSHKLRERLERVRRRRKGVLAWLWPPRRQYLDGLIWGMIRELDRRDDGPPRHESKSPE